MLRACYAALQIVLLGLAIAVAGGGCASHAPVPVVERAQPAKKVPPARVARPGREADWRPSTHVVERGDTLHAIALAYGHDYREIAEINAIAPPYLIRIGQELKLPGGPVQGPSAALPGAAVTAPLKPSGSIEGRPIAAVAPQNVIKTQPKALKLPYSSEAVAQIAQVEQQQDTIDKPAPKIAETPAAVPPPLPAENSTAKNLSEDNKPAQTGDNKPERAAEAASDDEESIDWVWPSSGKILTSFGETSSKGIDIGGRTGQPVVAAAPGKVVYSGSNLRGYGNLVIIKHNKTYLSAYAHNSQVVVKEGQQVTRGQKIAEMGKSDADSVKLHFEIRRLGKPVDPLKYLPDKT